VSRAVVFDAILADGMLGQDDVTFDRDNVLVGYDGDQRPSDKMFIVIRWEEPSIDLRGDDSTFHRGPRALSIWVHMYREFSTDFGRIDKALAQLDSLLTNIIDTPGADGQTVTLIEPEGHSRDLRDVTYETFCRSASYRVLSRNT
jgi:hypothetical protein